MSRTGTPNPQGQQGQPEQPERPSVPNIPGLQEFINSQLEDGFRAYARQAQEALGARQRPAEEVTAPTRPVEIRIGHPNDYDGDSDTARQWANSVAMYLAMNEAVYDTDQKKIIFAHSFMTKGTAASWADNKNEKALVEVDGRRVGWGTWKDWIADFGNTFYFGDHRTTSRQALQNMRQTGDVKEYITKFRFHAGNSGITDNSALIGYFQKGIKNVLMEKIYAMETVPTTIEGWINKAQIFENNWKQGQIVKKEKHYDGNERTRQNPFHSKPYQGTKPRDPNAMDVDRITLSPEEKDRYFREALCFECGQKGHRAAVCRNRQGPSRPRFNPSRANIRATDTRVDPKDKAIAIKALLEGMTEEEKASTFKTLGEDVDF